MKNGKDFLIDERGVRINSDFHSQTGYLYYAEIERVYVEQDQTNDPQGVASLWFKLKPPPSGTFEGFFYRLASNRKDARSLCIHKLSLADAEGFCKIVQDHIEHLTKEDIVQMERSVVSRIDAERWLGVIFLTIVVPIFIPALIPWLNFESDERSKVFAVCSLLLVFLSYKYWRLFFTAPPKSPQLAYLTVYTTALLCVIFVSYLV